jgi:ADP-ribose pyrophosphatase YjhB (NUDIX family)
MKATLVASVILEHESKYLFVQQARSRRQPGKWGPPGGKPDHEQGETLFEAAIRETFEETGLAVELSGLVGLIRSGHQQDPNLFICFAGRLTDPASAANLRLKEGEIMDGRWLTLEEIEAGAVPLRSTPFATIIRRYQAGQIYPLDMVQHEAIDQTT